MTRQIEKTMEATAAFGWHMRPSNDGVSFMNLANEEYG